MCCPSRVPISVSHGLECTGLCYARPHPPLRKLQGNKAWCEQQSVLSYLDLAAAAVLLPLHSARPTWDACFAQLQALGDAMDTEPIETLGAAPTSSWGCAFSDMPKGRAVKEKPFVPDQRDTAAMAATADAPTAEKAEAAAAMWGAYQQQRAEQEAANAAHTHAKAAGRSLQEARAASDAAKAEVQKGRAALSPDVLAANELMDSLGQKLSTASLEEQQRLVQQSGKSSYSVPEYHAIKNARAAGAPASASGTEGTPERAQSPNEGYKAVPEPATITEHGGSSAVEAETAEPPAHQPAQQGGGDAESAEPPPWAWMNI